MLLLPVQQTMYEKIGQRNFSRKTGIVSGSAAFIFLWLWGIGVMDGAGIYESLMCIITAVISFARYRKLKREIMPLIGCSIRLEEELITVRQPGNGKYEPCSIFYSEVAQVMRGSRYRQPSFFIVLCHGAEKSRIGETAAGRKIFLVRGDWYERKEFLELYRCFCRKIPKGTMCEGLEIPDSWRKKPVDWYTLFLGLIPALLLFPVLTGI